MSKSRVVAFVVLVAAWLFFNQLLKFHNFLNVLFEVGVLIAAGMLVTLCLRSAPVSGVENSSHVSLGLALWRFVGSGLGVFFPHYGQCYRCLMPWAVRKQHITHIDFVAPASGVFAICECCFRDTRPEERLRYYAFMWADWVADGMEPSVEGWTAVKNAVLCETERTAEPS